MSPRISTRLLATQSDERLLALIRQGHERAFEALVHRYRRPLLSYCRRLGLAEARAEDVLQHALLNSWIALSEGVEVYQLKAWLYRIVHNTAVNAMRDAAHDPDRLVDPSRFAGAGESDLDRGLATRQALAEVAALPPLQREVIVRTAVAGHSHERVASDLGLTRGAVRGLAYRARVTLRTAVTALTPPSLVEWLAGGAAQGVPAPERLAELAAGGGTAGLGGLLVKGGVVAITAGTLITSAVVQVHGLARPAHRHPRPELAAIAAPRSVGSASGESHARGLEGRVSSSVSAPGLSARGHLNERFGGSAPRIGGRGRSGSTGEPLALVTIPTGGHRAPRSAQHGHGEGREGPGSAPSAGYGEQHTTQANRAEGAAHAEGLRPVGYAAQVGSPGQTNRSSREGEGEQGKESGPGGGLKQGDGLGQDDESSRPGGSDGGQSNGAGPTASSGSGGSWEGSNGGGSHENPSQGGSSQVAGVQGDGSNGDGSQRQGSAKGGEGSLGEDRPAIAPTPSAPPGSGG